MTLLDAHNRASLRALMRKRRAALPVAERRIAAEQLLDQVVDWPEFQEAHKVAAYVAMGGELDPKPLTIAALDQGKKLYLPVLSEVGERRLVFRPWAPGTAMADNRLGIPEPPDDGTPVLPADALDLVFVPLIAADPYGHRLGQGAGFYDRSFAFLKQNRPNRPKLAGLAYPFQIVEHVEPKSWDVPLDYLVTPKAITRCRPQGEGETTS